ncbi:MAG: hypothetical protein AAGH65_06515 [Pseudomonadota bacterium]
MNSTQQPAHKPPSKGLGYAAWVAIGIGMGTAIGVASDRLALWIPIGIGIGLCLGYAAGQSDEDASD